MMKTIEIPNFKFKIDDSIRHTSGCYVVYDISYSVLSNEWYYRYKYWEGGYEHYCKLDIKFVEENFVKV